MSRTYRSFISLPVMEIEDMKDIERFIVDGQQEPVGHYCHAVRHDKHVWISGTVGITGTGVIPADTVDQFKVAMQNFDAALRTAGGKPKNIVKVTIFLTDIQDRLRLNPIREAYFGEDRPASTLVEVTRLVLPGLKVEIEGEAIIS